MVSTRVCGTLSSGSNPGSHPRPIVLFSQVFYNKTVFYLYILKSRKDEKLYVGYTSDLRRRLGEHNSGKVKSTKSRAPFDLKYYEAFSNESEAKNREYQLKKDGRAFAQLKKRIIKSLL